MEFSFGPEEQSQDSMFLGRMPEMCPSKREVMQLLNQALSGALLTYAMTENVQRLLEHLAYINNTIEEALEHDNEAHLHNMRHRRMN